MSFRSSFMRVRNLNHLNSSNFPPSLSSAILEIMKRFVLAVSFWFVISLFFTPSVFAQQVEYGIAAQYPFDEGIKNNSAVIFASGFEESNWLRTDFGFTGPASEENKNDKGQFISGPADNIFSGQGALEYKYRQGSHDPKPYTIRGYDIEKNNFNKAFAEDTMYLRWYRKYQKDFDFSCDGSSNFGAAKLNGIWARNPAGTSPSCVPPRSSGDEKFSVRLDVGHRLPELPGNKGFIPHFYFYHLNQPASCGDSKAMNINPIRMNDNQWYSYELMIKANTVKTDGTVLQDGELKLWIDGILRGHYSNLLFRKVPVLKLNELSIIAYYGGSCPSPKNQKAWDDNLVLATQYIGPMVTTAPEELIVDNDNSSNESGNTFSTSSQLPSVWTRYPLTGENSGQHYQGSHHFINPSGTGTNVATWRFTVSEPGEYEVSAWWWDEISGNANRATDVPYTINHASGIDTVKVDQRINGQKWNSLGSFDFVNQGSVSLSDDVTDQTDAGLVADAIRLVKIGESVSTTTTFCDKGDGNEDFKVNSLDLASMISKWFTPNFDLDFSGVTNDADAKLLLTNWGGCE